MNIANQNLKYLRKLRGWTQQEFADKLRIKRSLIGAYEDRVHTCNNYVLREYEILSQVNYN